jgi:hypothetical protein
MMKLGMFTGKVYPKGYDTSKIKECCMNISDDKANDESFVNQTHLSTLAQCISCMSCPEANAHIL